MSSRFAHSPVAHSLFFAIRPEAGAVAQIRSLAADLRDRYGLIGKTHAPDRLHITLCHVMTLPDLPPSVLAAAREAAASITMRPFKISLDRVMSYRNNGALVLCADDGVAGAEKLQEEVHSALLRILPSIKAPPRQPHLTLLYDRARAVPPHGIEPISWWVDNFELIDSHQGLTVYRPAGRWPLRSAVAAQFATWKPSPRLTSSLSEANREGQG